MDKEYFVAGTSRNAQSSSFSNLSRLGIKDKVETHSMVATDFRSVLQTISDVAPDEIYNLAGQSSVGLSFQQPVEAFESIAIGVNNLLESIRFLDIPVRIYNAGSSECFGDTGGCAANEESVFHPRSPYATAKSAAHWMIVNYREAYNIHACSGILFNHESPLRPRQFVTQKIISAACDIARGNTKKLTLGNLSVSRDWGSAAEYVDAMWRMLQLEQPQDFVIATGVSHKLEDFCNAVFSSLGLEANDHIEINSELFRPADIPYSRGDAGKAKRLLGWSAKMGMEDIVRSMVEAEMSRRPILDEKS